MRNGITFLLGVLCSVSVATQSVEAQQVIPVLALPAASATSAEMFGGIVGVRELANGGILVDDGGRKQIKMLGPTLGTTAIVLDSIRGAPNYYGTVGATPPLIRFPGDSTLFPDMGTSTLAVFDPHGVRVRTAAMPKPADASRLIRHGRADQLGRVIFSVTPPILQKAANGNPPVIADSELILRADLRLRTTDTIARVARPMSRTDAIRDNGGMSSFWNPGLLGTPDEWDVLTDGSIALVRGHDYHIDWIRPDGARESSPKMPFDWRQLTDADKDKMIDSAQALRLTAAHNNTLVRFAENFVGWGDGPHVLPDTAGALYSLTNGDVRVMVMPYVRPPHDRVFDYYPPIRTGAVMADVDNHLWILPTTSKQSQAGELVYDIVNTKGELFERVRAPVGRFVVGFGKGGVVYLASGSLAKGFVIERTKVPASGR